MPHFGIKKCAKMGQPDKSYVKCALVSRSRPHFFVILRISTSLYEMAIIQSTVFNPVYDKFKLE